MDLHYRSNSYMQFETHWINFALCLEISIGSARMHGSTGIDSGMHCYIRCDPCLGFPCFHTVLVIPLDTLVFILWLSVLCMCTKAWLAAPALLAHAEVTKIACFSRGPKLRYPLVPGMFCRLRVATNNINECLLPPQSVWLMPLFSCGTIGMMC